MATVRKVTTEQGISWKVDYYDPQGRRIKKRFKKKAESALVRPAACRTASSL
ncbi:hypothetical protein [Desulfobacca acetoxidans]|uniref:Uncharacterized protein n=1 Tax=Desulfobacca acetoxidans (strain ATCC 700848 / DSM 11109 / ASRB2) TaxID=880072 RepID=F2NGY8_DESAR|nr:hypothetical protein [Desulfobacca acetoxidans]AEB08759.1 hypothetical protein Desac_0883 [Desulfobacca acetoxidans DSM 11109]